MDLNRLYSDHQKHLMSAEHAPDASRRDCHADAAGRIATRIGGIQRELGAAAASAWEAPDAPGAAS